APPALFVLTHPVDVTLIEALAQEQDRRIAACHPRNSCPQDHYVRGFLALFSSRTQALASFHQVQAEAPGSRFAAGSSAWIDLLNVRPSAEVAKVTEDLVWEVLEREFRESTERVRQLFRERATRVGEWTASAPVIDQEPVAILKDKDQP